MLKVLVVWQEHLRYLDRELRDLDNSSGELKDSYLSLLNQGIDILETDLPVQVSQLIFKDSSVSKAKAQYFKFR